MARTGNLNNLAKARSAARLPLREFIETALKKVETVRMDQVLKILASCPVKCRRAYLQSILGELSPMGAIRQMCRHCVGWERMTYSVSECTARGCPLYAYRPVGSNVEEGDADA